MTQRALHPGRLATLWCLTVVLLVLVCGRIAPSHEARAAEPAQADGFPRELVSFAPAADNPVFTAGGAGQWDAKIRERGWIMREGDAWHLWYTGYDGSRDGIRQLGYATSPDGLRWTRSPDNPLCRDHWVEDMMVVKQGDTYYMFAEGRDDQAQLLTSQDRVHWNREGTLDIRYDQRQAARPAARLARPRPGSKTDVWQLFYERMDAGVWLATSRDLEGLDQRARRAGAAAGSRELRQVHDRAQPGGQASRRVLCLLPWQRRRQVAAQLDHQRRALERPDSLAEVRGNPIVAGNKSSGIVVFDGGAFRLYTMHEQVDVYFPRK